jgi:hypothetical protein
MKTPFRVRQFPRHNPRYPSRFLFLDFHTGPNLSEFRVFQRWPKEHKNVLFLVQIGCLKGLNFHEEPDIIYKQ